MSNLPTVQNQSSNSLSPQNFGELQQFAQIVSNSSFIPKDFRGRLEDVMIAVQMGAEVGLKPIQALHSIAVINGRPSIWGDAMIALVRSSGLCEYIQERYDEETQTAVCTGKRRGEPKEQSQSFSMEDARKAGLANKTGPWKSYPKRMLQMKARGFLLRDLFADVLQGLITREEALDYPSNEPAPVKQDISVEFWGEEIKPAHNRPLTEDVSQPLMMTQNQSDLIGKLVMSHVFTEEEKEKTAVFIGKPQKRSVGKKMIDWLIEEMDARKLKERNEKNKEYWKNKAKQEDVPFGGVIPEEKSEAEILEGHRSKLYDLIAGLDNCERAVDVSEYIEQVTGALLLLPEDMQDEFNLAQGARIKKL
ncbi:MAG: hypothetical protein GY710_02085 [Desulfobacteraceae bacterium]|nr:hypothetical protein [Desulfobacteraceae bacterium]